MVDRACQDARGLLMVSLLVLALLGTTAKALAVVPGESSRAVSSPIFQPAALPTLTARASLAVDITAGVELWAQDADRPLPPASTTKLMTALVARRWLRPDESITIRHDDLVDPTVYANAGLQPDDRVTVTDLLAAMLIASAGDAALALARVAGERIDPQHHVPRAVFIDAMNQEAARLGLRHSRFATPDGRDAPGQTVSARDLAIIAAAVLGDPLLAELVATRRREIEIAGPQSRRITVVNTNQFLTEPDALGVKTGTSAAAGQCLVAAVRRGNDIVVLVLLNSRDRYADARALLTYLDREYRWLTLDSRSFPELASLAREGIVPALVPTVVVANETADRVRIIIDRQYASADVVGTVRLRIGTSDLFIVPLLRLER